MKANCLLFWALIWLLQWTFYRILHVELKMTHSRIEIILAASLRQTLEFELDQSMEMPLKMLPFTVYSMWANILLLLLMKWKFEWLNFIKLSLNSIKKESHWVFWNDCSLIKKNCLIPANRFHFSSSTFIGVVVTIA